MEQRDQLLREIEALRNKVIGIEMAISLLDGDAQSSGKSQRSVKGVLLDLLREVGTTGLSAATAVDMANRRGITLHSGSAGSTLSRLKSEGVVVLHGNRYVLKDFAPREDMRPVTNVIPAPWANTQK